MERASRAAGSPTRTLLVEDHAKLATTLARALRRESMAVARTRLQWSDDPGRCDAEEAALAAGPLKEMTWHRDSFGGVPQLFVDLDQPSPIVRAQVQDLVCGAHVGHCMTKAISPLNEPATPGPG